MEPVILRTPEDGDHQPRPADHDQRGHHPPLGVGARAKRGLEAPRCRVDHRLQEHLRLPQVGLTQKWFTHSENIVSKFSHGVLRDVLQVGKVEESDGF